MNPPFHKNRLRGALERGIASGNLDEEIDELGGVTLSSRADAEAVCWALEEIQKSPATLNENAQTLAALFQEVADPESPALDHLAKNGIPLLSDIFDKLGPESDDKAFGGRLFLLKILAMCASTQGTLKVIEAARQPIKPDAYLWSVILQNYTSEHPEKDLLYRELSDPLPPGFIGISLLDAANAVLLKGDAMPHPFDSREGCQRLRALLTDPDPDHFSYAHSATAALPFIGCPERDELLGLAMNHPDSSVQMEAAWAAAKIGRAEGLDRLVERCRDFKTASAAAHYLSELGREDLIPPVDPNFNALAEFAQWLAHPNELGRAPDEMRIVDRRELAWPPARETKPFWLIEYVIRDTTGLEEDDIERGLVGSITFCLFSYNLAQRPPEDCYAIHAYWEMEHAASIEETDVRGEDQDYRSLLKEWTGPALESPQLAFIAELSPELKHPQRIVGLASACLNGEEGWVVLDGPRSSFYPKADLPAGFESVTLKMHIGRELLGFKDRPDRRKFLAAPKPPKTDAQVIEAYEKELAMARTLQGEKREEALNSYSIVAKHFVRYCEALARTGRAAETPALIQELAPEWEDSLDGLSLLAAASLKCGQLGLAERFLAKFRSESATFERSDEADLLAELWLAQGKASEAKQLLVDSLKELLSQSKTDTSDRAYIEECYQARRQALLKLFPSEAETTIAAARFPKSTLD